MAKTKRVTGYIGPDLEGDWAEYVAHLGISESAATEWAIRAEVRRFKGENTKEKMLEQIIDMLKHQEQQVGMLQKEKWTQVAAPDGKISIRVELDEGQFEQLRRSIFAHGLGK